MLTATIDTTDKYDFLSSRFRKAYAFLRDTDLKSLPLGVTPIDGEEVYAQVQEYNTLPAADAPFEGHRRYFDLHYMIEGEELFGYIPASECKTAMDYDPTRDLLFFREPEAPCSLILHPGELAAVSPDDAHAPRRISAGAPVHVRKLVIKVKV